MRVRFWLRRHFHFFSDDHLQRPSRLHGASQYCELVTRLSIPPGLNASFSVLARELVPASAAFVARFSKPADYDKSRAGRLLGFNGYLLLSYPRFPKEQPSRVLQHELRHLEVVDRVSPLAKNVSESRGCEVALKWSPLTAWAFAAPRSIGPGGFGLGIVALPGFIRL